MIRTELEIALGAFTRDALAASELESIDVLQQHGSAIKESGEIAIIVSVTSSPHIAGNLGHANASIILSSPHETDYEDEHREYSRFLRAVFAPAIAPDLPPNAAIISDYILAATNGEFSGGSYHVEGYDETDFEGGRQNSEIKLLLGIIKDHADPLTAGDAAITV